jgi:hypothetical protein
MSRYATVVLLICIVASARAQSDDTRGNDVIQHYVRWRGGSAFQALRSIHLTASVMDGGIAGTKQVWATRQGLYLEHEQTDQFVTSLAVWGKTTWRTNLSGQPEPISRSEANHYGRDASLLFAGIFAGELGATIGTRPDESFDGLLCNVFRVSFGDTDTYDFFIALRTGELKAVRSTVDRRIQMTVYAQWHVVDGVRQPFAQEVRSSNQASQSSLTARSIVANELPAKNLLQMPNNSVPFRFSKDSDWSGWIKFDFVDGKRIFIPAEVNGRKVLLLLDSGAETTVLGKETASGAGISCAGQIGMEGSGGSDAAALCTGVSVSIGNASISGIVAARMDLDALGRNVGLPIAAILGQEVFNSAIVDIDFQQSRIAFRSPTSFTPPNEARRLALSPWAGDRIVSVSVEGMPAIPAYFDLGNGSPLDLFPSYWKPLHLLDGRAVTESQMGGSGGKKPVSVAVLKTVSFAGIEFRNVRTNFTADVATTENSEVVKGNVGMPIFDHFHLMIDYPHNQIYMIPYSSGPITLNP